MHILDLTTEPWFVDLGVWAGVFTAIGVILRMVVWPGLHNFWRAVVAAPRIAESVGRLVELLETDVLKRVELAEVVIERHGQHLANIDAKESSHGARLDAHDARLDSYESRVVLLENLAAKGKVQ